MMIVGLVVGFITVLVSDFIYVKIHNRGIWNEEKDVNHSSNVVNELVAAVLLRTALRPVPLSVWLCCPSSSPWSAFSSVPWAAPCLTRSL